jgi:tetratricopeptide (TPR) repeat protein
MQLRSCALVLALASTATASPLDHGIALYDKKDYAAASIELDKVLQSGTPAEQQRAQFFLGKTLYQLGIYASALTAFDGIVKAGVDHPYHGAVLKWLAALSRVLPETSGILDEVGSYDASALDDPSLAPVRDELVFLLARHHYEHGDYDDATALFQRIPYGASLYLKAKFFAGVTHVRKYEGQPAVDAFKQILEVGEEHPPQYAAADIANYRELAQLQLARVFYSTQQFSTAIKYFEKLPQDSADWAESLFEAAWAYYQNTGYSKALGNIHTLQAPYFENQYYPEALLLRAVIYHSYCLYDQAEEAIGDFNETYAPLAKNLRELVAKYDDNAELYGYVKRIQAGKAGLDPAMQRLVTSVLADKTLRKTFAWVDELDRELALVHKSDPAWQTTQVAARIVQDLTVQQSVAATEAGKLARERIERLERQYGKLARDGIRIQFEILNAKASAVATPRAPGDHPVDPIVVDEEHSEWRFDGEYWKDELGYYRFRIRSRCPQR